MLILRLHSPPPSRAKNENVPIDASNAEHFWVKEAMLTKHTHTNLVFIDSVELKKSCQTGNNGSTPSLSARI